MALTKGARGEAVRELQQRLVALGYELPRFGVDGDLGEETLGAVSQALAAHGAPDDGEADRLTVDDAELSLIAGLAAAPQPAGPASLLDCTGAHPGKLRRRARAWSELTGICLHQTACVLGETPARWFSVPVQVGITRAGKALLLNPLESLLWHGNGFNVDTVGIEIDGHYAGIEGDLRTYWRPASEPHRKPLDVSAPQLTATRDAIRWICAEVARHGGRIQKLYAHRQSSGSRRSDPGSALWQGVAVWARETLGLETPLGETRGSGRAIPREWDAMGAVGY
jgi:peptidoglycan hydrolase-like protein with peptidoglycan-binding domain